MKPKKGFTIIEVIVALAIAAVASAIFFDIISTAVNGLYLSQKRGLEIYSVQQTVEDKIRNRQMTSQTATSLAFNFNSVKMTVNGTMVTNASKTFYIFMPTAGE